ncbi:DUF4376 domain-containing protein [Maritalea mediterranea]|uniref:DUF4376 domain-containing protein n=1 Tax=Maritalea mediterranea TaxID=2909667 RepID=A0ABS9E6W1_9HYPH|nr:DUF4376 domain-containing protein [Maritalea mediterranea]MCF4098607.1 DUF4376 domain-containing protein [Maritalea mediterranea]
MLQLIDPSGNVLRTDVVEGRSVKIGDAMVMPAVDGWEGLGGYRLETYVAPEPSFEERKEIMKNDVTVKREEVENSGFIYNGVPVKTTRSAQNMLANTINGLKNKPEGTIVKWEASPGMFVPFDLPALEALSDEVFDHVNSTFLRKEQLFNQIDAAQTEAELDAIDINSGW